MRIYHWVALLAICFWIDYVAAAPLPGVQWSRLSIWEASALADVWSRTGEYLDFRSYALCGLSDLGYLDHLLDDFAPDLRVLAGYGAETGLVCLLATAAQRIASTRRRSQRSQGAGGDEEKTDDDDLSKE